MANYEQVSKLRGMPETLAEKLKELKITNTDMLVRAGCDPSMRRDLAQKTGADPKVLLEMINRADLDRVPGIGAAYGNLLEEAGVDTVKELSKRVPEHLHAKLLEINTEKKITTHPPTLQMVEGWVKEAKTIPVLLTY